MFRVGKQRLRLLPRRSPSLLTSLTRGLHLDLSPEAKKKLPASYEAVLRENVDAKNVVIKHDPTFGFAAFTRQDIARGEVLMRVGHGALRPLSAAALKDRCAAQAPAFSDHVRRASLEFAKSPFGVVTGQDEIQRADNFESLCHVSRSLLRLSDLRAYSTVSRLNSRCFFARLHAVS